MRPRPLGLQAQLMTRRHQPWREAARVACYHRHAVLSGERAEGRARLPGMLAPKWVGGWPLPEGRAMA